MHLAGPKTAAEDTGIRMIPPVILLAALIVAALLQWLIPIRIPLPDTLRWVIGLLLFVLPFAVVPSVFAAFRRADSEYDVRFVPKGLVTSGAFRYSRNPGYVAMLVSYIGLAVLLANPWMIVCLIPAIVLVHYRVVLREEAVLERTFGEEYRAYKQRVRRWL